MHSTDILNALNEVAATPGKNDKIALVTKHIVDADFLRVLELAYNPFIRFYMDAVPAPTQLGASTFTDDTFQLLRALSERALSGNAALEAVVSHLNSLDGPSQELLKRIIKKDLRAGFGESTINKARPKTIPTFPYMRCSLPKDADMDNWDWANGIYSQIKADGMFMNVNRGADQDVSVTTRQGSPVPLDMLGDFGPALGAVLPAETQTHGEALVYRNGVMLPRHEGNGMLNSVLDGGELEPGCVVVFHAWDQIPLAAVVPKGKVATKYRERLKALILQLKATASPHVKLIDMKIVRSKAEAYAHYREALKLGLEGTVEKHPDMPWADGTSKWQVKLKLKAPVELKIVGFNEGTGKNVGKLGSFQMASECGKLQVNVNGRTDAQRAEVWANKEKYLHTVGTVEANAIMYSDNADEPHSLFLPVWLERRLDKSRADTFEQIVEQFSAAVEAA